MDQRIAFTVSGRVQGVFFRKYAQKSATAYSLTGFVKNVSDGSVTGEAQGAQENIDKLVKDLHKGPKLANVDKVDTQKIDTKSGECGFEVTR